LSKDVFVTIFKGSLQFKAHTEFGADVDTKRSYLLKSTTQDKHIKGIAIVPIFFARLDGCYLFVI
jgi:hypothetical protein